MKNLVLVISILALCTGIAGAAGESKTALAVVVSVIGNVEYLPAGQTKWQAVNQGGFLEKEDQIRTGANSKAAIVFTDGTEVRLNAETTLHVRGLAQKKTGTGMVNIVRVVVGQIWAKITKSQFPYEIQTSAAIAAVKGTKIDLDVHKDQQSIFYVLVGTLEISNEFGSVTAGPMTQTIVNPGKAPEPPTPLNEKGRSDWESEIDKKLSPPTKKNLILKLKTDQGERTVRFTFEKDKTNEK